MTQPVEIFRKIINKKVLLHSTFWTSLLIIVFLVENWEQQENVKFNFFVQYLIAFLVFIGVSYTNVYFLIPRFFKKKRYLIYTASLIVLLVTGALVTVLQQVIVKTFEWSEVIFNESHGHDLMSYFFHIMFGELMLLVATTLFLIMDEWIKFQNITIKLKDIESQKVQSELQALKAQINPHFLFNTLNNIYSHSLEKSPKTPEMILKLSELMSYILYECKDPLVPVKNEIHFIKNYIELEKLRYEDRIEIQLEINENDLNQQIAPLVFIAFIENAFKHNGNKGNEKPYVKVKIKIDEKKSCLNIENSKDGEAQRKSAKEGGIGIENVKKRLDLIYPGHHELTIKDEESFFEVKLELRNDE